MRSITLSEEGLLSKARTARAQLERAFSLDTAQPGTLVKVPSSGQCAAVAIVLHEMLGGVMVSAIVDGQSHWFNRVCTREGEMDVDVTADQFGFSPVRIARAGELYPATRIRQAEQLSSETRRRAKMLKRLSSICVGKGAAGSETMK